mmetsp:Transcript_32058/g.57486  ORF Transcript_32058/g.57486 Transcript_32058/m.57486 type:complete len:209 (-) Transcript_32058:721-1347(-)
MVLTWQPQDLLQPGNLLVQYAAGLSLILEQSVPLLQEAQESPVYPLTHFLPCIWLHMFPWSRALPLSLPLDRYLPLLSVGSHPLRLAPPQHLPCTQPVPSPLVLPLFWHWFQVCLYFARLHVRLVDLALPPAQPLSLHCAGTPPLRFFQPLRARPLPLPSVEPSELPALPRCLLVALSPHVTFVQPLLLSSIQFVPLISAWTLRFHTP